MPYALCPMPVLGSTSITSIQLRSFRNYRALDLNLSGASAVITGDNGSGKTNLIEAISLFAPGRGLRGAATGELAFQSPAADSPFPIPNSLWSVVIDLQTPHSTHRLGTGNDLENTASARRAIQIDEKSVPQNGLGEYLTIAWATPDMDRLFLESAGIRRRFLDRLVYAFKPDHWMRLNSYDKARAERAKLLELGRMDDRWLAALENAMAESGHSITQNRLDYIERLNAQIGDMRHDFPRVSIHLQSKRQNPTDQAQYLDILRRNRRLDAQSGTTNFGAHRDDISAWHIAKARNIDICSTGEQKIAVLSILLSHTAFLKAKSGRTPILLLDELTAHLDGFHRGALAAVIDDLGAQTFLTGADPAWFSDWRKSAEFFALDKARIAPIPMSVFSV